MNPKRLRAAALAMTALPLAACGNMIDRIAEAGKEPSFSQIENPNMQPGYQPVSMPMPKPMVDQRQANSLWRQGSRAFFADQRAGKVGDILTVAIDISDEAKLNNKTTQSRDGGNAAGLDNFLGYEGLLDHVFPDGVDPTNLVNSNSTSDTTGTGAIDRKDDIKLRVAAIIVQVLPNGNLVLKGTQQVRVNYELRELNVTGIIRPEDISTQNEIDYDKIAEARIAYGGKGTISDVQQPRYGQQVYDILFPF
jgi:flagellar L-ring protein precursor FlgH